MEINQKKAGCFLNYKMDSIFEVLDKTGRRIKLTKKQWKHITFPSSPHSYMNNYLEEIKQTLINPDKIISSVYDDNKTSYYKYHKDKKRFIRIIVKYLNGEGYIITTYFVKHIK